MLLAEATQTTMRAQHARIVLLASMRHWEHMTLTIPAQGASHVLQASKETHMLCSAMTARLDVFSRLQGSCKPKADNRAMLR